MSKIFINLPVVDLPKATEFYQKLGFVLNPQFSNNDASGLQWDENLYVMLLTHEFTKTFIPTDRVIADSHKTCGVLNAIQFDTKDQINDFFNKAINAGGKLTKEYDHGFMYGKDFEDLDGYIWEAFWMDMSQMPTQ